LISDRIFENGWISFPSHGLPLFAVPEIFNLITSSTIALLTYIGIILVIGIPVLGIIYGGIKLLFRIRAKNRIFGAAASSLWFIGIALLIISGFSIGKDYRLSTNTKNNTVLEEFTGDTLFVKTMEDTVSTGDFFIMFDEVKIKTEKGKNKIYLRPELNIIRSNSDKIEFEVVRSARGGSLKNAKNNTGNMDFGWKQVNSELMISPYYTLRKKKKWRNQRLFLTVKLPENKIIYLDPSLKHIIYDIDNITDTYDEDMLGDTWIMTNKGLLLYEDYINDNKNVESLDKIN